MDWFWVFQQPKGQKRKGKGQGGDDNESTKKRKPPKPKPEPVEPPEQHHILDPVAEDFLKFLRLRDLKSARLVCRKWRKLSNKDFHDKSVTEIHNQMGDKTTDKVLENRICSSYHVKNLEFLQFRPSHFLGEIFQLRGDRLNELTINIHSFHFFLPVLRCCYECMPNLIKLKFDNTSHPKHCTVVWPIRGRLPGSKILKTCKKTLNLKSFTFRPFGEYFHIKPTPAWMEWDREEFMNYLKACPQLVFRVSSSLKPLSDPSVFEGFLSMPNLKSLELLSPLSSDKEKIFSNKASEALRENNLVPRIIGNRYGSFSRMDDNFM